MSIISIQRIAIGQVGINPGRIKVVTTDSFATITAAGYFNGSNLQGITIGPLDVLEIDYAYNASTGIASWAEFLPTITNGIITISASVSPGNVLLPVVSGDFPIFNGTGGQIKDSGMSATDATKTKLVALNAAPLVNHIAYFTNANGTIGSDGATIINSGNLQAGISGTAGTLRSFPAGATSGVLIVAAATNASGNFNTTVSNATAVGQSQVISIPDAGAATGNFNISAAALVSGNLLQADGTGGRTIDSGIAAVNVQQSTNLIAATTANIGGGGAGPISVVVAGLTAASIVVGTIESSSNAVQVQTITATATGFDVVFSGDPGASCLLNYIAFVAAQ